MTLGDRVAVMNDGKIEQVDPPQTLYDFPASVFVAEFIGSPAMNVLPVTVVEDGNGVTVEHDGFRLALPQSESLTAGSAAAFGIRPEDVYLAGNGPADVTTFEVEVTVTEPLGESLLIHADVGGEEIQIKAEPRSEIRPGERIEVAVDPRRLHLFDPESGEAIYHSAAAPHKQTTYVPE